MKLNKDFFKKFASEKTFSQINELNNAVELIEKAKNEFGNCNATLKLDGSIATFNDLYNDTNKVASCLNGVKGKNIALVSTGNYSFEVASLAIMSTNNVAVLIPSFLDANTIQALIKKFDIEIAICDKANANKINQTKTFVIEELLNKDVKENFFAKDIKNTDIACILLTSGTTGKSKGVVLSHEALMSGTINGCYGLDKVFNQVYYCMIPLTNSFGFIRNMLCSIYTGSMIYYNIDKMLIFQELAKYKPTVLILVPTLAELFLNIINSAGLNAIGGKVHTVICGSANVPPYLPNQYNKLNINFCPGYGLTEFANIVTGNPEANIKSSSVGFLFPNQEAKIVDGELWLKGRNMFKYYFKEPEENKKAFVDGWFRTGDLAKFDQDNHIYIVGRIKNLIVLSTGEKISPEYVENKVNQLDLIQDSLVYCSKNQYGVETLICEVFTRKSILNQLKLNSTELIEFIQKHIDKVNKTLLPYQQIKRLIVREKDFERSPTMKIIRKRG